MNMITGNTYLADVQIKSPMGQGRGHAHPHVGDRLLRQRQAPRLHRCADGLQPQRQPLPLCCSTPKLPFGVLQVSIEVDIDGSGVVTGIANAPRHRPMPIKGQLTAAD